MTFLDVRGQELPVEVEVTFIVVSWNGAHLLRSCLDSIRTTADRSGVRWEVIVVDNGSADGSVDMLRQECPDVRIIANPENRGFAHPNNQAFAVARGRLLALVNNDIVLDPDWLPAILTALEGDHLAGVATQIRFQQDPDLINSTGIEIDRHGVAFDRDDGIPVGRGAARGPVFGPCAGAAVLTRDAVLGLGGFDEDLFAYYEDVDFAWRARRAGYAFAYEPNAVCHHAYSQTSARMPGLKEYLLARNRWMVVVSNIGRPHLQSVLPSLLFREVVFLAVAVIDGRAMAELRGRLAAIAGVRRARSVRSHLPYLQPAAFQPPQPLRRLVMRRLDRRSWLGLRSRT